jgi:hypothetical protein
VLAQGRHVLGADVQRGAQGNGMAGSLARGRVVDNRHRVRGAGDCPAPAYGHDSPSRQGNNGQKRPLMG